jgi:N-acetylneuraminate synthase/N,N'-diacetyllegionaminate synthase
MLSAVEPISVDGRRIGPGSPCFVAAEVGINHDGDTSLAHRLIDAAADAGADAVKFQNYRTEDFLSNRELTFEYESQGRRVVESQYDMFKRYELDAADLTELRAHCEARNVVFFSTPTSEEGVADLVRVGAQLLKNGSDYLLHRPLVREMAKTGLPTVLSVGMATLDEIHAAVQAYREAGGDKLVLLHCTSAYPTPPDEVNLRRIPTLAEIFACPVGFSDHSVGVTAAVGAVALGACMVEKHFTLDRSRLGPDHRFSSDPAELVELVEAIRFVERSLGDASPAPTETEIAGRRDFRLSCIASQALTAGHVLATEDIAFRRPGTGLPPHAVEKLIGRRLLHAVDPGHVLTVSDVD